MIMPLQILQSFRSPLCNLISSNNLHNAHINCISVTFNSNLNASKKAFYLKTNCQRPMPLYPLMHSDQKRGSIPWYFGRLVQSFLACSFLPWGSPIPWCNGTASLHRQMRMRAAMIIPIVLVLTSTCVQFWICYLQRGLNFFYSCYDKNHTNRQTVLDISTILNQLLFE